MSRFVPLFLGVIWPSDKCFFFLSFKVEQSFQDLNLIYCELTSLLALTSYPRTTNNPRANRGKSRQSQIATQASEGVLSLRVREYVIQLLRGETLSGSQIGRTLTPTSYSALLPTIWSLLNQPSATEHSISSDVLRATLEHATKTSSNSAVKKLGIEFVARLALVSPAASDLVNRFYPFTLKLETELQYQGVFRMARTVNDAKKFDDWLVHLPKALWELESNNLSATEVILRFLLRLFQRKSCLVHHEVCQSHVHSHQ